MRQFDAGEDADGDYEDLMTKLDMLVRGYVQLQGGGDSVDEVDYYGTTSWYKK
jgi:hypothetical protein